MKMYSFILFNGYIQFYCKINCPNNQNGLCKVKFCFCSELLEKNDIIRCLIKI